MALDDPEIYTLEIDEWTAADLDKLRHRWRLDTANRGVGFSRPTPFPFADHPMKSLLAFVAIAALSLGLMVVAFLPGSDVTNPEAPSPQAQAAKPAIQPAIAKVASAQPVKSLGNFTSGPCAGSPIPATFTYTAVGAPGQYLPGAIDSANLLYFQTVPGVNTLWAFGMLNVQGIGLVYQAPETIAVGGGPAFGLLYYGQTGALGNIIPLTLQSCSPLTLTATIPGGITVTCVGQ